jgi:hypothetical protein
MTERVALKATRALWATAVLSWMNGDASPLRELAKTGETPSDNMAAFIGLAVLWKLSGRKRRRPPGLWSERLKNVDFCRAVAVTYYLELKRIEAADMQRIEAADRRGTSSGDRAADAVALKFRPPLSRGAVHRAVTKARKSLGLTKRASPPPQPRMRTKSR